MSILSVSQICGPSGLRKKNIRWDLRTDTEGFFACAFLHVTTFFIFVYRSVNMPFFIVKVVVSGILIAIISSLAKTFPKWAALLTALPLMTFLSLTWIYAETKDLKLLENYTKDVLIWLIPSLFFFIAAIYLFRAKIPFAVTMLLSTTALFAGVIIFEKLHLLK